MDYKDMEKEIRDAKSHHLTKAEIDSYIDQELDEVSLALVEAHLKRCLICEGRLALFKEEAAALGGLKATADDIALARRVLRQTGLQKQPPAKDRLAGYLLQSVAGWQAHFAQGATRGPDDWRWQSEDGALKVSLTLEENADLTIHILSNNPDWEGVRLKIRLGAVSREVSLRRVSESEIGAKAEVKRRQRPKNLAGLSIEIV